MTSKMIGRALDWIGIELLSKLCIGHVMWGLGLGIIVGSGQFADDIASALIIGTLSLASGFFGMAGHYIYRWRAP